MARMYRQETLPRLLGFPNSRDASSSKLALDAFVPMEELRPLDCHANALQAFAIVAIATFFERGGGVGEVNFVRGS
jgi:hypothetical protein